MSEQEPSSEQSTPDRDPAPLPAPAPGESLTEGGYAYTLADDSVTTGAPAAPSPRRRRVRFWLALAAAAIVPAAAVGAAVWFVGADGEDSGGRQNQNVSNVINAFSQGGGAPSLQRYEGELPPGYPDDLPEYPDADLIASLAQGGEGAAGYLVVYDTTDDREDVAAFFADQLNEDPWQIDAGRDGRESTLHQFSKIDDADVSGVVLSASSKDGDVTTIVVNVQIASGARDVEEDFELGVTKPLPEGFPEDVPQYPDAIVIESAFQNEPGAENFIISFVTRDNVTSVFDFYRQELGEGWTVEDADASESPLEDAQALSFSRDDAISGGIVAGVFAEDRNYTQVDLTVRVTR